MPKINPTIEFFTLGCKANQYDTQSIRERLFNKGFLPAPVGSQPDYCLINTCTVTSGADQKSRNIIRRCIQGYPQAQIIVTGCLVEKDWSQLQNIPGVDLIIKKSFFAEGISSFSQHTRAFLKIQDGCSNFCTYCKVALVRGKERSKNLKIILQEAKRLVDNGYREIVLTGICLGAYGKNSATKDPLVKVIHSLADIPGLWRLRLSSIEAGDVTPGLIKCLQQCKKLCLHLHIPIQSGDDRILKLMNRKYSRKKYEDLIANLKAHLPGIAITTDCLVGFPGESEASFENTVELVKKIIPLKVHVFPYSSRPLTRAARFTGSVDPKTIRSRCRRLAQVAQVCRQNFMQKFLGNTVQVLVEDQVSDYSHWLEGLTGNYLKVRLPFITGLKNTIINVRLKQIRQDYLVGEYVDNP